MPTLDTDQLVSKVRPPRCKMTILVDISPSSLTEVLFQDALEHARKLDKSPADQGTVVGPLQGVPMTLKDQFNVKGHDTTLGYVGRAFSPAAEDAALVKMLQSLGAIMLAKTNLPQSIMVGAAIHINGIGLVVDTC